MRHHDIIVVEFSALGVEALARLSNLHTRVRKLSAFHLEHEPIELATPERS